MLLALVPYGSVTNLEVGRPEDLEDCDASEDTYGDPPSLRPPDLKSSAPSGPVIGTLPLSGPKSIPTRPIGGTLRTDGRCLSPMTPERSPMGLVHVGVGDRPAKGTEPSRAVHGTEQGDWAGPVLRSST
jgi:hypothetical protein